MFSQAFVESHLAAYTKTHTEAREEGEVMSTTTFAGRASEEGLAFMNALTRQRFGMSFGQYCGSILIQAVRQGIDLPQPDETAVDARRRTAVERMRELSGHPGNPQIGRMSDAEIKDLVASRYVS